MKKIVLILIFLFGIILSNTARAENFTIDKYFVDINVLEDKTFEISEQIDADFTILSHGLYRNIPTRSRLYRPNGTYDTQYGRVYDVSASDLSSKSIENSDIVLKMGNPDKKITGKKTYNIKYKYYAGNDNLKDSDEFYHNIIGSQWKTTISKVYFTITLPKDFDSSKIKFYMGQNEDATHNPKILNYKIKNNQIIGYTKAVLNPFEGLTIRIELPDGYFIQKADFSPYAIAIAIVLTIFPILLWAIFGKDEQVIPVVNFNVPKNKNSAEVEVEYMGRSTSKGIFSLIFYLANKGYLKIIDDGVGFTIIKIKNYDGVNSSEKAMMNALFPNENEDSVSSRELEKSSVFYERFDGIQNKLNKRKNYLFEKESLSADKIAIILVSILGLIILSIYTLGGYTFDLLMNGLAFFVLFPIVGIITSVIFIQTKDKKYIFAGSVMGLVSCLVPALILLALNFNLKVVLFEFICIAVSIVCLMNMPKRNLKGRMFLGQILGLKKYLEVVEKNRLIGILKENPNYISDILPYAYVLDVVDNVLDCVQGYREAAPDWYSGSSFNRHTFNSITSSLENSVTINRSSSGGGHFGGGGGGGGGSW